MIYYCTGSIFDSPADVLVCPVNCVGAMGKGLALEFKRQFPKLESRYLEWCQEYHAKPGQVFWANINDRPDIALMTTKLHWRNPSQLQWIMDCMENLFRGWFEGEGPGSIAIPALGCGLGGLNWDDVKPIIESYGDRGVELYVYPPK